MLVLVLVLIFQYFWRGWLDWQDWTLSILYTTFYLTYTRLDTVHMYP